MLQYYLAEKRFPGYNTNENWISGIITVNAPLNGCTKVYSKGLDISQPPIVRWGSEGCLIGWFVHIVEFFNFSFFKIFYDFNAGKKYLMIITCYYEI